MGLKCKVSQSWGTKGAKLKDHMAGHSPYFHNDREFVRKKEGRYLFVQSSHRVRNSSLGGC